MANIDSGLNTWRRMTNHNRMMEFQRKADLSPKGPVELAFLEVRLSRLPRLPESPLCLIRGGIIQ